MNEQEKDSIAVAILALAAFVLLGCFIAFCPAGYVIGVGVAIAMVAVLWAFFQVTR